MEGHIHGGGERAIINLASIFPQKKREKKKEKEERVEEEGGEKQTLLTPPFASVMRSSDGKSFLWGWGVGNGL
jgi:hypothetical protein